MCPGHFIPHSYNSYEENVLTRFSTVRSQLLHDQEKLRQVINNNHYKSGAEVFLQSCPRPGCGVFALCTLRYHRSNAGCAEVRFTLVCARKGSECLLHYSQPVLSPAPPTTLNYPQKTACFAVLFTHCCTVEHYRNVPNEPPDRSRDVFMLLV